MDLILKSFKPGSLSHFFKNFYLILSSDKKIEIGMALSLTGLSNGLEEIIKLQFKPLP